MFCDQPCFTRNDKIMTWSWSNIIALRIIVRIMNLILHVKEIGKWKMFWIWKQIFSLNSQSVYNAIWISLTLDLKGRLKDLLIQNRKKYFTISTTPERWIAYTHCDNNIITLKMLNNQMKVNINLTFYMHVFELLLYLEISIIHFIAK
jgi:hypothetical protein